MISEISIRKLGNLSLDEIFYYSLRKKFFKKVPSWNQTKKKIKVAVI